MGTTKDFFDQVAAGTAGLSSKDPPAGDDAPLVDPLWAPVSASAIVAASAHVQLQQSQFAKRVRARRLSNTSKGVKTPTLTPPIIAKVTTPKDNEATDEEASTQENQWCITYERPTFRILTKDPKFVPREVFLSKHKCYLVYENCKYLHTVRRQSFLPGETLLAIGAMTGGLYMCPIYNVVDKLWFFVLLGKSGYDIFPAKGRTGTGATGSQLHFKDARLLSSRIEWTPVVPDLGLFNKFLDNLPNPIWKPSRGALAFSRSPSINRSSSRSSLDQPVRRSGRQRKSRAIFNAHREKQKVVSPKPDTAKKSPKVVRKVTKKVLH